jgi:hypothetical protein
MRSLAQQAARETVEQLRHHPSVFAWGVAGNVDAEDDRTATFVAAVVSVVRSMDKRPVYAGLGPGQSDKTAPFLDLAGILLRSSDLKEFRSTLASVRAMYKDRPALVLSYGPQVEHENRNGYRDPWSQEAQARFYLQHIAALMESGFSGGFVDAFSDWRGDRPVLTIRGGDRTLHPVGLVSLDREKRLAYDVVRSQYQEEKFAAIPAGSYRTRFPASQVITGLLLIIIFGYQYSYNRRFGESVKRAMLRSYNFFADLRDRSDVPVFATFILSVCLAVTLGVIWASILHHFRMDPVADAIMTLLLQFDALKLEVILASWDTLRGIAVFSALSFLVLVSFAMLIKVVSIIARVRLPFGKAWNITVWGALPLILLSPIGMSLFKVMETTVFILPVIVLIGIVCLWALMRIVKGTSVVLDVSALKTYTITLFVCVVVVGAFLLFGENQWAVSAWLNHLDTTAGIVR